MVTRTELCSSLNVVLYHITLPITNTPKLHHQLQFQNILVDKTGLIIPKLVLSFFFALLKN